MNKFKIVTEVNVSYDDVECLLISAFEGGSNYWYKVKRETAPTKHNWYVGVFGDEDHYLHQYPLSKGGSVIFTTKHKGYEGEYILDLESIERGLNVMAQKYKRHFNDVLQDQADADTGDVFLQCCLFGELIFG